MMHKTRHLRRHIVLVWAVSCLCVIAGAWAQDGPAETTANPAGAVPVLPATPYQYANIPLPLHLAVIPHNIPADNPITDHGATLGRVLFYDRRLSVTNTVACASCHFQAYAFTDPAQFSTGFAGAKTRRNAMGLSNSRFFRVDHFFWDARVRSLEDLVLLPIQSPIEMGSDLEQLVAELAAEPFYPPLFAKAFGTPDVTADRLAKAVAQFLRAIVSYRSKYDVGVAYNFRNFTSQELFGKQVFETQAFRCALCHMTDTHMLNHPRNNGLDVVYTDKGVGEITGDAFDNGRFKPPSLRNVALTAPYMHDGRFATLSAVLNHYSSGIRPHPNLDPFLPLTGVNLTQTEREALMAFLQTLTDESLVTDVKFSDPFAK